MLQACFTFTKLSRNAYRAVYKILIYETSRELHRRRSRWWGLLTIPPKTQSMKEMLCCIKL